VALLREGHRVSILARRPDKIPLLLDTPGVSIVEGGLDDEKLIRTSLSGHDACIHNALYWEDAASELELKDTRASAQVFQAAADAGVQHIIYTSSTAVHRPFRPHMDETMVLQPGDLYGATKAAGEAFLWAISHGSNIRANVIRPGPVVGVPPVPGAPFKTPRKIAEIADAAIAGTPIRVVKGEGRQLIGARDLARLFIAVLHSEVDRQIYLGVSSEHTSWEQIAREAIALTNSNSDLIVDESTEPEDTGHFDATKMELQFGLALGATDELRKLLRLLAAR
jgi:UDP-glucose 4-epimerase